MRLASFRHHGRDSFGVVESDGIRDLGALRLYPDLRSALAAEALPELLRAAEGRARVPLDKVTWLPPIPAGNKILCVGLNYRRHAEEAGMAIPTRPSIFVRFSDSQVGHQQAVVAPWISEQFDFEGELAVVIGKRARHVPADRAMAHVAGYSIIAENSVRDFQRHERQATPGKNFTASGAFGPWIVTADEIADPHALMLETRLNGTVMQRESTADMIFSVGQMIEYMSSWTELQPGDVISTGTPSGVGFARKPPVWLKPGDRLEIEIEKIGTLVNPVAAEERA